jgi:hypothetical protein
MIQMTATRIRTTTPMIMYWFLLWMALRRRISLFKADFSSDMAFISLTGA